MSTLRNFQGIIKNQQKVNVPEFRNVLLLIVNMVPAVETFNEDIKVRN